MSATTNETCLVCQGGPATRKTFHETGVPFSLTLCERHAVEVEWPLALFWRPPVAKPVRRVNSVNRTTEIRYWARENGLTVRSRGTVPADILAAYDDSEQRSRAG